MRTNKAQKIFFKEKLVISLCLLRLGHVYTYYTLLLALQLYGKTAIQKYYPDRNYA